MSKIFSILPSVGESWLKPYRCSKASMSRIASEYSSIPDVVKLNEHNLTVVSSLTKEELDVKYNKQLSDYDIAKIAIDEFLKEKGISKREQMIENHLMNSVYVCKKTDLLEHGEHKIEIDNSDVFDDEQVKKLKEQLDEENMEMRSNLTKEQLAKPLKGKAKLFHVIVDVASRHSKNSIRHGIRPKYLNVETGRKIPNQAKFDELFSMFTLVEKKSFDTEKFSMPFTGREIAQSCKMLKLPHYRGYLLFKSIYLVPNQSIDSLLKFFEKNPDFTSIIDDELELPPTLTVCIALFNAMHVKGYISPKDALLFIGEVKKIKEVVDGVTDEASNTFREKSLESLKIIGEFFESTTTQFRNKYFEKEGVGATELYMKLIKILPEFVDDITLQKIQEKMEED